MTSKPILIVASAVVVLAACEGFKNAMTAHVDVAAKAGSQELSADRLGALLGQAKAPPTKEIATAIANLWVNYQLLGTAAARGDSLKDPKLVDQALWSIIAQERVGKWHDQVAKTFTGLDTANLESRYDKGELLAASHILLTVPPTATPAQKDSIRKRAEALRREATSANFADLAKKNSQDPSSAVRGGALGLFPKGAMVKEFETALLALKPGEISPVVTTQFGYHIIRRSTFAEVKDDFSRAVNQEAMRTADSLYLDKLEKDGNVKIADHAITTLRNASSDLDAHAKDDAVIATSTAGPLTLARLVKWVDAYPQKSQIESGLKQAPDSQITKFVNNVVRNELVLHQADSANVQLDSSEMADLHNKFLQAVSSSWERLDVSPTQLADSGKTPAERERIAAAHVDAYLDKLMRQQVAFVFVPQPIESVLRDKYEWKINDGALQGAVDRAEKERAKADSARARNQPKSVVPLGAPAAKPDSSKK